MRGFSSLSETLWAFSLAEVTRPLILRAFARHLLPQGEKDREFSRRSQDARLGIQSLRVTPDDPG